MLDRVDMQPDMIGLHRDLELPPFAASSGEYGLGVLEA